MSNNKIARFRKAALGGAAAAAVALPLALTAGPAQAATLNGCTVNPLAPVQVGTTAAGLPIVQFRTAVWCLKDHIVQIQDQRFERDDPPAGVGGDDSLGGPALPLQTFAVNGPWRILRVNRVVPNTEFGPEEVYHRTRFRVATINGVTGFTPFQNSAQLSGL